MKMFLGFVRLLPLAFAFACSGADQAQDLTGETRQALMAGDQAVICLPGSWTTDDGPACEDRSGVRVFEIGECHIKVARKCNLAPEDGGFECKCKIKVLEATDRCDDIVWADLGVSKC